MANSHISFLQILFIFSRIASQFFLQNIHWAYLLIIIKGNRSHSFILSTYSELEIKLGLHVQFLNWCMEIDVYWYFTDEKIGLDVNKCTDQVNGLAKISSHIYFTSKPKMPLFV